MLTAKLRDGRVTSNDMQVYPYKVAESREAMEQNNNTNGAKLISLFLAPNGITFSRNGAEITEVILCTVDKRTGQKKEVPLFMADFPGPDGTRHYELKGMGTFAVWKHNADAVSGFVKHVAEGSKARSDAKVAECKDLCDKLKGAGLSVLSIRKAAEIEGYKADVIDAALKS